MLTTAPLSFQFIFASLTSPKQLIAPKCGVKRADLRSGETRTKYRSRP
jgi:hypothetical protein